MKTKKLHQKIDGVFMLLTNLKTINYENLYKKLKETTPYLFCWYKDSTVFKLFSTKN
jgi:hypothetical protein